MADMPPGAFTWVPTPAGVCPMEMTMTKKTYEEIGGYLEAVRPLEEIRRDNPAIEISLATPSGLRSADCRLRFCPNRPPIPLRIPSAWGMLAERADAP